jgi:ABC-type Na+ efflux pump permease subunit
MSRILLIAKRDYVQTVLSKAYLIGLVLLPLMFGGGFLVLAITNRTTATVERIAVVDHTGVSAGAVIQACEDAARKPLANAPGGFRQCRITFSRK